MNNVAWTSVEVSRPVLLLNSYHERVFFPTFMLVLSTPTATQLLQEIPNDDMQLSMLLNSSFAVPPFNMHKSRRHVFTFPRLTSKIHTVSGFILSSALLLEPSVARHIPGIG